MVKYCALPTVHKVNLMSEESFYNRIGGEAFFTTLVNHFYEGIVADDVLRPMYPEDELAEAKHRLATFLSQYWGGPTTYQAERGHPRLFMRHARFAIDTDARERWLKHMKQAVLKMEPEPALRDELWTYLVSAAFAMQNIHDDAPPVVN